MSNKTVLPGHIKLWSDIWEDHYDGRYCKSMYLDKGDMSQLYKKMEVLVGITNVEEADKAQKALAGMGGGMLPQIIFFNPPQIRVASKKS